MPIAAATLTLSPADRLLIEATNAEFDRLVGSAGKPAGGLTFLQRSGIAGPALEFLSETASAVDLEANDGQSIGGRHFAVRLARLSGSDGGRRCMVSLIDRTAQVETEKSLRGEMLRDSLTGLLNRVGFSEEVEAVLEAPRFREEAYAVLALDMTRFSRVNECVGAIAGDELLITFARRLFSALRAGDLLARTGGDEFAMLMKLERGIEDALQAAQRIKTALATPFRLSELEIRVDCAVGCAMLTGREELSDEVLRNAQFAMKRAKVSGRTEIYEAGQARAARRRFSIETELRRALEAEELTLAFQPLIDLRSGRASGFEALARWDHQERGPIEPSEFIPVAEESGLILPLGRWALDAAAATLARWDRKVRRKLPLSISVNLSAIQVTRDDVPAAVEGALRRSGIEGRRLTIELTESAIIQDPNRAAKALNGLKALGARVAMDDFGTGYTSLAYLQRLPIDILKIDRSLVTDMLKDADSVAIIRAVLSLASALGMDTTAEGIDSAELGDALMRLGCSHGQGYHFSRPLEPQAALDYWLARNA
jgi:diguanylate cyclase (GGDEF)-like protein